MYLRGRWYRRSIVDEPERPKMVKEQVQAWRDAYREANRITLAEARAMSMEERLRRIEDVYQFIQFVGRRKSRPDPDPEVIDKWRRLYEHWLSKA